MGNLSEEVHGFIQTAGRFLKLRYRLAAHEEEEVAQEISLQIAKVIKKDVPIEKKDAYIRAIARNVTASYLRRKKNLVSLDQLAEIDLDPPDQGPELSPLEAMIREENHKFLFEAITYLGEEFGRTLLAIHCERLSAKEVAEAEGVKLNTVYWRVSRAEEQLMGKLQQRFSTLFHAHRRQEEEPAKVRSYRQKREQFNAAEQQMLDLHFFEEKSPAAVVQQLLPGILPMSGQYRDFLGQVETLIAKATG